ncbi:MAG: DEAD/DEAH box helicase, partial [Acidobacteria bacterium]|nr:DEAD/DEAH box helicase [Acidobacteriota bacterium]
MIGSTAPPPLESLAGIGPKTAHRLRSHGLHTSLDLLYLLPVDYEDRRQRGSIPQVEEGGRYTLVGRLRGLRTLRLRGRRTLVLGKLEDESDSLAVRWLNRPYLASQVEDGELVRLHGEVCRTRGELVMTNSSLERLGEADGVPDGGLAPVYPAAAGLGPSRIHRLVGGLLESLEAEAPPWLEDPLPAALLAKHRLPSLSEALERLHRPAGRDPVEDLRGGCSAAHRRLVYGELLELILTAARLRRLRAGQVKPQRISRKPHAQQRARELLPFEPTGAQSRCLDEIFRDLETPRPMRRLLQGDVGSGKTAIAAQALALVLESGYDAAYMAPTQLLAEQHFFTLQDLLGDRFPVRLHLAGRCVEEVPGEESRPELVVGTHALLEERALFRDLALVVIDEQHRFG